MMFWFTSRGEQPGDFGLYRFWQSREDIPARPLHLRAQRILVQPNYRRLPRAVINRHDIKPAWAFADVTLHKKSLRRANHQVLFFAQAAPRGPVHRPKHQL